MASTATTSLPFSGATDKRWIVRLLPSLTDFAFLIPAVLLVWLFPNGLSTLLNDGDTGWHIRTGEWILQHHAIPHQDFFSFTRPGQAWFAWEWGWDVLFAFVHSYAGLAGVVFINLVLLCFVAALLFRSVRAMCRNDLLAFSMTMVGLGASMLHWLARPHLMSWVFFLVLMRVLRDAENGKTKQLLWLPALVLVWTNVHGSFFVAVFMIVLSAAGQCLYSFGDSPFSFSEAWRRSRPFWACAALSGAATFVNPYTWHVHAHIVRYFSDSFLMDEIEEFKTISFHHGPAVIFGWLLLPGVAAVLWCFQKRYWSSCLALIVWAHLSLLAARNIPFFVFVACPLIAGMLQETCGKPFRALFPKVNTSLADLQKLLFPFERVERCYAISALVLGYVALCLAARQPGFQTNFPRQRFPVEALPVIERVHATRIFAGDQWSDYLIYNLYPSVRVFVDGRSDFFGGPFLERCQHILSARWDWEADLNRFSVDMVIVTPEAPVATALKQSRHWRVLLDNGSLIVFGVQPRAVQAQYQTKDSRISAVLYPDGGNRLGADLAFKYRTPN